LIFGKKNRQSENQPGPLGSSDPPTPKYHRPKILMIDMKDDSGSLLEAEGYNVVSGSFGVPYRVPKEDSCLPVIINGFLPPNFTEREIIVIDLVPADPLSQPKGEKHTSPDEIDWWTSCTKRIIDPSPD
jgi:hypothetical protein